MFPGTVIIRPNVVKVHGHQIQREGEVMPTTEYVCLECGHRFSRLFLRGEPAVAANCPECGTVAGVEPSRGASGLFDGIANFSDLAKDTN